MTFLNRPAFLSPRQTYGSLLFERFVSALFYLVAANLFVVFFVQGGYDFTVGPFHLHAYSPKNWLLLCLALAIGKAWLAGTRTQTPVSEWIQSPLLLFLSVVLIYSLNGRTFDTSDAIPARYLPLSLIQEFDFDLDEFPFLYNDVEDPYFLRRVNDRLVSAYPPWAGVLALPVYLVPVLLGISPRAHFQLMDLEKRAAVLITALSVLILLFALRRVTRHNIAWVIAVIYAFGTSSFSTSSQALWQHGPSQLFLALAIYCLARGLETPKFSAYAGLALGSAVICRPLNILIALLVVAYIVHKHRDQLIGFLLATVPPVLLFMSYNHFYFGSPFTTGFSGEVISPSSLFGQHLSWFRTPILEGLAGVLGSPARGLFIHSPIFLFSCVSMVIVWREPGYLLLKYLSLAFPLLLLPIATLGSWWGGTCYGPRLLADITPILCLLLYPSFERFERKALLKYAIVGLSALSVFMHAIGVFSGYNAKYRDIMEPHHELLWSWVDSPPVYLGKQILTKNF